MWPQLNFRRYISSQVIHIFSLNATWFVGFFTLCLLKIGTKCKQWHRGIPTYALCHGHLKKKMVDCYTNPIITCRSCAALNSSSRILNISSPKSLAVHDEMPFWDNGFLLVTKGFTSPIHYQYILLIPYYYQCISNIIISIPTGR